MIRVANPVSSVNMNINSNYSGRNPYQDSKKSSDDVFTASLIENLLNSYNKGELQPKELIDIVNSKCARASVDKCMKMMIDNISTQLKGIIDKNDNIDLDLVKKYNNLVYIASYL
jgi:hypothetical protein